MAVSPKSVDLNLIKKLSPLDTLSIDKIEEVLDKSVLQKIPTGKILFQEGDRDQWTVYLLSGEIELSSSVASTKKIVAGESAALKAVSEGTPRIFTATARTQLSVLIIDTQLFRVIVNGASPGSIEVSDVGDDEDEDDWMSKFLQSNAFIQLPAANMQAVLMKLQEVQLSKGKMVIREGDTDDQNYYIIKQGSCIVSRKDEATGKQKPLAVIGTGIGFGEEALITGIARGATVSMKSDGVVLKLFKDDFIELLVKPILQMYTSKQIEELKDTDLKIQFVDVRNKIEHAANGIEGSIHSTLRDIRDLILKLDDDIHYVIYSNTEHRASAAAFLFIQQNLDASVLKGGVGKPSQEQLDKVPEEIIHEVKHQKSEFSVKELAEMPIEDQAELSTDEDDSNNDIDYYKKKLSQVTEALKNSQAMVAKLKQELLKTREIAQKEAKIAKNAVILLKKAEAKLKGQ
ncbi:MAG: cyclic nucleotide-binding domain-containing protein [Gammaproteobacteria bacterium]|nr:cyclic nucleotide-binding domain-containing protein [Gammaproteobacteria bacterium]